MKKILIITTGGTIDKSYTEQEERLSNQGSLLVETLKKIRHFKKIEFNHLIAVDSNEITNQHRLKLWNLIISEQDNFDGFLITHGTDTLIQTAQFIKNKTMQNKTIQEQILKPVMFTGAMRPLSVKASDGSQNLSEALFAFEFINQGVHIVMHNQIYNPNHTQKNYQKMCFETIK